MHADWRDLPGAGAGSDPRPDPRAVVEGDGYRFTVLTSQLIRMEWSEYAFLDAPTQLVLHRRFPVPDFTVRETDASLDIWTEHLHLSYDTERFSPSGLSVSLRRRAQSSHRTTWHFGDPVEEHPRVRRNLWGTARTLDDVDGTCELSPGILAAHGYAVVDDSRSAVLTPDGWVSPRPQGPDGRHGPGEDLYFFGYGRQYREALRDYLRLAGPSPLPPRWALGNWWSRYHPYGDEEYLALMDRFAAEGVPFSVAVLDMDWHLVDIDPALGSGWTGYTWNAELFPDPAAFLGAMHARGLAVALNVHPADGVRRHEEAYPDVARDLGVDPATGLEVAFDIASRDFAESYLRRLHHPHEDIGVDFWWLDWQSGSVSTVAGLDPLWVLNHVHYLDSGRRGSRPLILSRHAGHGSHRYPIGFSGDAVTSWASLDFQPYFTATAANVGYFWWSHDIGGHLGGQRDDELTTRWYQFGTFSPVNRLHSARSLFTSKEPWRFSLRAERVMTAFLRLRHQLVPYLYTAAWSAYSDAVGVVRPMYHDHPEAEGAYEVPNQYMLGEHVLVAPITEPADERTHLGQVRCWLPEGTWWDFFSGHRYTGGRSMMMHRPVESLPVLVRAGAVVPLLADPMEDLSGNPEELVLRVFPAGSATSRLYEDDGRGRPGTEDRQQTTFETTWRDGGSSAELEIAVAPPSGPGVRTRRTLTVELVAVDALQRATLGQGAEAPPEVLTTTRRVADATQLSPPAVVIPLGPRDLSRGLTMRVSGVHLHTPPVADAAFPVLDAAAIPYAHKEAAHEALRTLSGTPLLSTLHALALPGNLYGALLELVDVGESVAAAGEP